MSDGDDDDDHYNVEDLTVVSRDSESIRQTLENKRKELEDKLRVVKHALNLMGGNDQSEAIYRAIDAALTL